MAGRSYIFQRELGGFRGVGPSTPSAFWGHDALAFERECSSDPALVRRLACTAELPTQASSMSNVTWSEHGDFMASGGEDCRIVVWSAEHQKAVHTLDLGHISTINCVRFLPASNNEQMISCGSDRQVRLVSLRKNAVKPFCHHRGKVKTAVVLDPNIFMSGSDDGTVRQIDIRAPPPGGSQQDQAQNGHDNMNVIADQRQERTGCAKTRVGVNSIAVMPLNPHIFMTGSSDALVRLYDRRMASSRSTSAPSKVRWVSCFVPTHLKGALITPRPFVSPSRSISVSGVAFSGDGQDILASYTSEQIYLFSATEHARPPHAFTAAGDPPRTRGPALPPRRRTRHATDGRSRNAQAAQAGNYRAAGTAAPAAVGEHGGATPANPPGTAQPRPSSPHQDDVAAAAAAAAPAEGNGEEPRVLAGLLQPFRPVSRHPRAAAAAAQPRQTPRRGESSPAQSVGGGQRNEEAAQPQPPASGGPDEREDDVRPYEGYEEAQLARFILSQQEVAELQAAQHATSGAAAAGEAAAEPLAPAEGAQAQDQSPQEAPRDEQSPEDGQGPRRAAAWRAGSRPGSVTGSALPPMAHSVGQLPNGAATRGTPSTTAGCARARLSPDLQVATSPVRRGGPSLRSQQEAAANAVPDHAPAAPQDDRTARRLKRRLPGGDATDSQAPANRARKAPAPSRDAPPDSRPAAQDAASPSARAAAPLGDAIGSPDGKAQEAHLAEEAVRTQPLGMTGHLPASGTRRVHALRRAGSTMAAEGHAFAVVGSGAERPTASTGTSRPRRGDGRDNELQSRLHTRRHTEVAPAPECEGLQPGAVGTSTAPAAAPRSQPQLQRAVDPRSLPFPVPLPRRGPSPAAAATASATLGIPEWPAPPPAAVTNRRELRSAHAAAAQPSSVISAAADDQPRAAPSRAGSSRREAGRAAGSIEAAASGGRTMRGEVSLPERLNQLARAEATRRRRERELERDSRAQAQSLPSSAAAITGTAAGEEVEPDVVGPPLAARSSRRSVGSAGEGTRRLRRGVDSAVGAIVEAGDGDEGDGEEVDESGMFQRSFHGHCNRVGCKEVALMGSRSQYVVSGSDEGHIFVWERGTGALVNLLRSSDAGVSCVAPHPHLLMLASCGHDPVVRLWSPEAQEMASLENAEVVMRRNVAEQTERHAAVAGPPPLWLNMIAPPGLAAELEQRPRSPRGHAADRGDNPVRCSLM